ncbi:MAG: hypothetical protein K2I05_09310, partial [Mailhella sp.]|nr:hypothetical protein [Mailhella sp.]
NITSANASAIMVVDTLFPVGFALEAFSTDQSIAMGEDTVTETRMGVDGVMAAGFVPSIKSITISFEEFSPSVTYLQQLYQAMQANKKKYDITLIVTVPSVSKSYTFTGGVLKTAKILADHKNVLDPVTYGFDFEKVTITSI